MILRPPPYEDNEWFYDSIWGHIYVATYIGMFIFALLYIIWNILDTKYNIKEKLKYKIQTYKDKHRKIKLHNKEQIERQKKWRLLN